MKKLLFLCLISTTFISCAIKHENYPSCIKEVEYKEIYVPVNSCVLDNISIQEPSKLLPFQFIEKNHLITIEDKDLKNLIKNLEILKTERKYYYDIILELKKK